MATTVDEALKIAERKKFISSKHVNSLPTVPHVEHDVNNYNRYGGRSRNELEEIATKRANDLLKDLPPIQNAVRVIKPDVAEMIDKRDELLKRGQKLIDRLGELSEERSLSDSDQKMTLKQFGEHLKKCTAERKRIVLELDEIGTEDCDLERQINKALYAGIPGLSDAVVKAIASVIDRCIAFDQMGRRVHEKVMFGDNHEAMEILRTFETDETTVNDDARAKLKAAIAKLGVAKPRKSR
jgi:hypothetical protein